MAKCSGRPSVSIALKNIANVCEGICKGHRWMIHDVWYIVGLSYGTCQHIMSNSAWGRLLQNSCQGCGLMTRSSVGWKSAWNLMSRSEITQASFPWWLLMMKAVLTGTTMKQTSNHLSGSIHLHPSRRRCGKWKAAWSQCWFAFSTVMGLSIRNSPLQVRPSMWSLTATS